MNRFLKKEWEDTAVSEEDRWRARNRAWSRYQAEPLPNPFRRGLAAAAGAVALVLLWILIPTTPTTPHFKATPAPLPKVADLGPTVPPQGSVARLEPIAEPRRPSPIKNRHPSKKAVSAARKTRPRPANDSEAKSNHVVLNFRLPESGVRMIWVQDADFYRSEGETQ